MLIGKGKELSIYDSTVKLAHLTGANRQYIDNTIPHIGSLIKPDMDQVIQGSEVLVIGNPDPDFAKVPDLVRTDQLIIDFSAPLHDLFAAEDISGGW